MTRRALLFFAIAGCAVAGACFPAYDFSPPGEGPGDDASIDASGFDATASDGAVDATSDRAAPGDGASDAGIDATIDAASDASFPPFDSATMIPIAEGGFPFGGGGGATVTLTHRFYVDSDEVTVARFRAFVDAGYPAPCDGGSCSLDPGGPYESQMTWQPTWNAHVSDTSFYTSCSGARDTQVDLPTYTADGGDQYPIGCVSWYQAVASCAFEGKRLPTEAEWEYVASGRGQSRVYPWGNAAPVGCGEAIWFDGDDSGVKNGCHWPVNVGTARDGGSIDRVLDLSGSVFEWVWDDVSGNPSGTDPISAGNASTSDRSDRGGSFGSDLSYLATTARDQTPADGNYTDIGFRCARTIP